MEKIIDYNEVVRQMMEKFWDIEHLKTFPKEKLDKIKEAYELAFEAHKPQKRKGGGPYITHPISVAHILAEEFQLGSRSIMAGFLHDVVEDTPYTIEDIRERFGDDVAFLVGAVTKEKKEHYEMSKQMDNYRQMLGSIHYDIRALLVKLADRLHNMRTLNSMRPDKQMKIAGETDYFYAPLANRLGLYETKTTLENLSMQYRCPQEYENIERELEEYKAQNDALLSMWCRQIDEHLRRYNIRSVTSIKYCSVYTIWKKMQATGSDFKHIEHKFIIQIIFPDKSIRSEKDYCLKIYSAITDLFKEMPGSTRNYIDSPKENGYQAFHFKILAHNGVWQKVQIASERMLYNSKMGCLSKRVEGVNAWIARFKDVLKDMSEDAFDTGFLDGVVANFYNDDIYVFTPEGTGVVLPKNATALDFAYEIHSDIGNHAQFARINGRIASVKTVLHRGDCVEIGVTDEIKVKRDWLEHTYTYKAKRHIIASLNRQKIADDYFANYIFCPHCSPLPGEEVIGFKLEDNRVMVHKRNCHEAIKLASEQGDNIINVDFKETNRLYDVSVKILAVDRYHLLSDLVNVVTNDLKLSIDNLTTTTTDEIVNCTINFSVHSYRELRGVIDYLKKIDKIEEVKRVKN